MKKKENGSELFVFKDNNKGTLEVESVVVAPKPLPEPEGHISYGGALRAGEGDAIAQYVEQGKGALRPGEGEAIAQYVEQGKRIPPRRGGVGVSGEEICANRHWRMNGVGIRKENQVCSGEDTSALAMFNYEEKAKRKEKIMAHLQHLVQLQIGKAKGRPAEDGPLMIQLLMGGLPKMHMTNPPLFSVSIGSSGCALGGLLLQNTGEKLLM